MRAAQSGTRSWGWTGPANPRPQRQAAHRRHKEAHHIPLIRANVHRAAARAVDAALPARVVVANRAPGTECVHEQEAKPPERHRAEERELPRLTEVAVTAGRAGRATAAQTAAAAQPRLAQTAAAREELQHRRRIHLARHAFSSLEKLKCPQAGLSAHLLQPPGSPTGKVHALAHALTGRLLQLATQMS